jgi:hypothetical protein
MDYLRPQLLRELEFNTDRQLDGSDARSAALTLVYLN